MINAFHEWFDEHNQDIPKGTRITATYHPQERQMVVTYLLDGEKRKRVFNVNYDDEDSIYSEVGVPRNVFEQNDDPRTVPLKMGVGGPVVGTATVDKDGNVTITEITDEDVKRKLNPHGAMLSFGLPDA